jgi:hypothetical protein
MTKTKQQIEELRNKLAELEQEDNEAEKQKREAYEKERENITAALCTTASYLQRELAQFKAEAFRITDAFYLKMLEYGDIRFGKKNKGSFEIKTETFKVQVASQIVKGFDERAVMAEEKIKLFLTGFVKKRDRQVFELVNALLERNEINGDFDINMINRLYKMETKYDDPNWREGIKLFKESYNPTGTAKYIRFSIKNERGEWDSIILDFAKTKIEKEACNEG